MKQYKYVSLKLRFGEYRTSKENGRLSHREVIDQMAERGWKYVDHIPVCVTGYGGAGYIDLIFEKDVDAFYEGYRDGQE